MGGTLIGHGQGGGWEDPRKKEEVWPTPLEGLALDTGDTWGHLWEGAREEGQVWRKMLRPAGLC